MNFILITAISRVQNKICGLTACEKYAISPIHTWNKTQGYEKKCDERILGAYKALRVHEGGRLKTRLVDSKGATLHANKEVLLLRILKDGRGNLSQGIRNYQSVVRSSNKRRKDYTADTTGLL